jgi:hypothetical protein
MGGEDRKWTKIEKNRGNDKRKRDNEGCGIIILRYISKN